MRTICFNLILAFLTLLFTYCKKNDITKTDKQSDKYVPGDLIVGIKSDITIDKVFKLFNEYKISISEVDGYFYNTEFPNDSLNFIVNKIKDKPYLNKNGFHGGSAYISEVNPYIVFVTDIMFDMDSSAQADWTQTISNLKLIDYGNDTKNLLLKVPIGTEIYWQGILGKQEYIKWAELNYIVTINPNP
jgi:hypothetical protein